MAAGHLPGKTALAWGSGTCVSRYALWNLAGHLSLASVLSFFSPLCLVYSGYKHKETGTSLTISIRKASKSGLLFTWSQCSAGIQLKIQNKTHHYYICENCSFFLHPSYSQLQYLLKHEDSREPFNPSLPFDKLQNYVMWHAGCIHVC